MHVLLVFILSGPAEMVDVTESSSFVPAECTQHGRLVL